MTHHILRIDASARRDGSISIVGVDWGGEARAHPAINAALMSDLFELIERALAVSEVGDVLGTPLQVGLHHPVRQPAY